MARIIRKREVCARVGLTKSTVEDRIRKGQFPKPINLGGRAVGFLESEIDDWIDKQVESSRASA